MTPSELMKAMADAGAPLEAILIAMRALEEKDAEIAARDKAAEEKRAADAARKRAERAERKAMSTDGPRTVHGRGADAPQVSPKEYISNPLPSPAGAKAPSLSDRVVEAWNEGPGANGASKARPLDTNRRKALCARLKEHSEDELFEAIRNLGGSDWHCGKNDSGWRANLGWLLKSPENFQKALEMGDRANVHPLKPAEPLNLAQMILAKKAAAQ